MSPLRQKYVSHLEALGYARKTVENYVWGIKSFTAFIGHSPATMTRDEVESYLLYLKKKRRFEPKTINLHLYALKSFCTFMLPEANIMEKFGRVREPKKQPLVLSRQQVEQVIACAENLKARASIALLYSAGLRLSEVCNLRIADVDSKRMILRIRQAKGGRDRIALLSDRALEILRDYYREFRPKQWLFEGYKQQAISHRSIATFILHARLRASIDLKISPHTFRHSFATHLLDAGESLVTIQRLLGHQSLSSTAIYTHVSTDVFQKVRGPFDHPLPEQAATKAKKPRKKQTKKAVRKSGTLKRRRITRTRVRARKGGRK